MLVEETELTFFLDVALDDFNLRNRLRETTTSNIGVIINLFLIALPRGASLNGHQNKYWV